MLSALSCARVFLLKNIGLLPKVGGGGGGGTKLVIHLFKKESLIYALNITDA